MIYRVEVSVKHPPYPDNEGESLLSDIYELGITSVQSVRVVKVYKLEGIDKKSTIKQVAQQLLSESLWQDYAIDKPVIQNGKRAKIIEVALKPGVMNTEIDSILKAVKDMNIKGLVMAGSGKKYYLYGDIKKKDLEVITDKLLVNRTVEQVLTKPENTLVLGGAAQPTKIIPLRKASYKKLMKLSQDKLWLEVDEMRAIAEYFQKQKRDPTDIELETIAQTWSEHCFHKTFKASLVINGKKKKPLIDRIQDATKKINSPYTLSVFEDNAGVIVLDKNYAIAGKVETHNSPSAIEPYGGAATGSGGVFRDIMATGQGAKTIISTDMFCFAPPDLPIDEIPSGCLQPRRLLKEVVRGVRDYGNRMGIPTNNGSVYFDEDFRAKPTIIVGAYGIMPIKYAKKGIPQVGDLILTVGGNTGRDGIHGATFSSGEMTKHTENVSSSAVQIGNPIEQKRMFDALLTCRDKGCVRATQDCGGGGFSSAIGEIAEDLGCDVQLEKAPLKYPGLAPWEIWLSESQERSILAIEPRYKSKVAKIFKNHNVPFAEIGKFTNNKKLRVYYKKDSICDLDMEFLHHGNPQKLKIGIYKKRKVKIPSITEPNNYESLLIQILSSWNVCSKEQIVRLYDHEVQGTSVVKPFTGVHHDGPSDAAVVQPLLGKKTGVAVAHGMHPTYNKLDPYWGTASAIDEAVRNIVCVGVDPARIALIDNFIFPKPGKNEIGQLDRAVDAMYDISTYWKMPFVSGKDSLSSTYRGADGSVIKIPPVVCISSFAPVENINSTVTSDLKSNGNLLFLIGETFNELGGSEYLRLLNKNGGQVPKVNKSKALILFNKIHKAIQDNLIISAHDCSDGGLAVTISEMCFGGDLGATIMLDHISRSQKIKRADIIMFSESNTRFIVEVSKEREKRFGKMFSKVVHCYLGTISSFPVLEVKYEDKIIINSDINMLKNAWQRPMKTVFE